MGAVAQADEFEGRVDRFFGEWPAVESVERARRFPRLVRGREFVVEGEVLRDQADLVLTGAVSPRDALAIDQDPARRRA